MKVHLSIVISAAALLAQTAVSQTNKTGPAKAPAKIAPAAPSARLLNPALAKSKAPELFRVRFSTTKGDFVVESTRAQAPLGADRFYNMVKIGFFTNVSFYRVVAGNLVQFGAPPSPAVAKAWSTASIPDDPQKPGNSNTAGSLTFAHTGQPNSRTTQLFFNLQDNIQYDSMAFVPVGKVIEGMDVLKSLYSGYGDMAEQGGRGPSQGELAKQGKPYLDKNFPLLDSIKTATIIFPEPVAPVTKKAPAKTTKK